MSTLDQPISKYFPYSRRNGRRQVFIILDGVTGRRWIYHQSTALGRYPRMPHVRSRYANEFIIRRHTCRIYANRFTICLQGLSIAWVEDVIEQVSNLSEKK